MTAGSIRPSSMARIGSLRGASASITAFAAARPASPARSALDRSTISAQEIWSSKTSDKGVSWSIDSSASRWACTASTSGAKRPAATASASASAMTPSTVIRERIAGQSKAFRSGFGSARPEVSIRIWSGFWGRAISASIVGMKVVGDGAADAAIGKLDDILGRAVLIGAGFQDVAVNADRAEFIDQDRQPLALGVLHQMADQRRFARAQKAGDDGDGDLVEVGHSGVSIGGIRARLCLRKITGRSRHGTMPSVVAA